MQLRLGGDERLAEVGKQAQDDETRRLRVAILYAEQEEAKIAAVDSLIAKKDEEKDALAQQKDKELSELKDRMAAAESELDELKRLAER